MTAWCRRRLKYLARINEQALPETTDPDVEFGYIDITSVGRGMLVTGPQRVRFGDAPSRARRLVQPGDTIVSTVRTYLRAVWPVVGGTDDLVVSTGFAVISPGPEVESRFLGWWTQSDPFVEEIVARSVGVSYPAINASEVGELFMPLPPLDTQRAIADYLDAETARIDALIEKKQRLIELLEERFWEYASMLVRSALFFDQRLDPPEGWRRLRLRRCFQTMDYGIGEATRETGAIGVLGMGNVQDGDIVGEPGGWVDQVAPELLLTPGDLLFNRTNSLALVGKVGLFEGSDASTTFASYLVRLRPSCLADSRYLRFLVNTPTLLGLARSSALPSIGQANLNPNRYGELPVVIPPPSIQRELAAELERQRNAVRSVKASLSAQIDLAVERRQALITAAVTGELAIPGVAV